jgi:hypothetical protein
MMPLHITVALVLIVSSLVVCQLSGQTSQPVRASQSAPATQRAPLDDISLKAVDIFNLCEQEIGLYGYTEYDESSALSWGGAYINMGYLAMYEGARDERYLNTLLERIERTLAKRGDRLGLRDDVRGKVMPCWINQVHTGQPKIAHAVHNGMIIYPMIRLVVVLQQDPVLAAKHADIMKRILADAEQLLQAYEPEYHDGPAPDEGWYYCPDLKADLPFNQQNALGRAMLAMYAATGKVQYRDRAARLARYFKYRLRRIGGQDGRYVWDYWTHRPEFEDVSHAAQNVDFVYGCHRAGIVFTRPDLKRFTHTFLHVTQTSGFSDCVDGSGKGRFGIIVGGWGHLGHLDPQVRGILVDYISANRTENNIIAMQTTGYLVETQYPDNPFYSALARPAAGDTETRPLDGSHTPHGP